MNCQEFESRVETLARGALADARTVTEAAAHGESCAPCAALLADERALSTGLRALASGMRSAAAPPRVESALLAAFRARAASGGVADPVGAGAAAGVVPMTERAPVRRWSWVRTAAVASLAAAASLALFVLVRPGAGVNQRAMIEPPPGLPGARPGAEVARGAAPAAGVNSPLEIEEGSPAVAVGGASHAPSLSRDRSPRATFTAAATAATPRARAANASYGGGGERRAPTRPPSEARAQEIATEFIPLMQGAPYPPAEESHLVRLELPRSALASFGLPVGAESHGGRVKADVLLGEDGIARAIRFVR